MLNVFTIQFENKLSMSEVPYFRGSVITAMQEPDILFHNHLDNTYRYSYPLIQYKILSDKIAIVCLGNGTNVIGNYFASFSPKIRVGKKTITLKMESTTLTSHSNLGTASQTQYVYRLCDWIPLNQKNYPIYSSLNSMAEKCDMLGRILTGNLLSFFKGIGVHTDNKIKIIINDITSTHEHKFKGINVIVMDIIFTSNMEIPELIGIGKGASLGHGTIFRK